MRGKFIVLEGIDGSGKSTQSHKLSKWLETFTGTETHCTYEPNIYRELLISSEISCLTELLIYLADRSEHTSRIIMPYLETGVNIICERWNASTLAYQNIPQASQIISLCKFPKPDFQIFLHLSPLEALRRITLRKNLPDKYEIQGIKYFEDLTMRYEKIARAEEMLEIECDGKTEEEIHAQIVSELETKLCQSR